MVAASSRGFPGTRPWAPAVDHSPGRAARLGLALALAALLGGCAPGFLGRELDAPPPLAEMRTGGPAGLLLQGPMPPYVPDELVDAAVAQSLRPWLTPFERRSLAEASQQAAAAPTASTVDWQATDGAGAPSAAGTVTPVRDVYRSVHGRLCRDLRQSVAKGPDPHLEQLTLCREDQGAGLYVWVAGKSD